MRKLVLSLVAAADEGIVTCELDGKSVTCDAEHKDLVDGEHTYTATAVDKVGNKANEVTVRWTIDTVAPVTTLANVPTVPTRETTVTPQVGPDEDGNTFICTLDGTTVPCDQSLPNLKGGDHAFTAVATDKAGNADKTPASANWTIDTTAPDAPTIALPRNQENLTKSPTEIYGHGETGATIEVTLTQAADKNLFLQAFAPIKETVIASKTGDWLLKVNTVLPEATYQIAATATDAVGNISPVAQQSFAIIKETPTPTPSPTPTATTTTPTTTPTPTVTTTTTTIAPTPTATTAIITPVPTQTTQTPTGLPTLPNILSTPTPPATVPAVTTPPTTPVAPISAPVTEPTIIVNVENVATPHTIVNNDKVSVLGGSLIALSVKSPKKNPIIRTQVTINDQTRVYEPPVDSTTTDITLRAPSTTTTEPATITTTQQDGTTTTFQTTVAVQSVGFISEETSVGKVPVAGAEVTLEVLKQGQWKKWQPADNTENPQKTDASGHYSFTTDAGTYRVVTTKPGYRTIQTPTQILSGAGLVAPEISLAKASDACNSLSPTGKLSWWQKFLLFFRRLFFGSGC